MKKYLSASAIVLSLCYGATAQNYNAGALYVNAAVYDASAAQGTMLAANSNVVVGSAGTWLLNNAVFTTLRNGTSQTEVVKFSGGAYARTSGYINGYASAENQAPGFVLPIGHSSYAPLTVNSVIAPGSTITAAWYDNQPLASTNINGELYYFLPGYYDLSTTTAGLAVTPTVPAASTAATHLVGTVDGVNFTDLGPATTIAILPSGTYGLRFANSSFALPVTLTAFTAARQGTTGQLSWKVSSGQAIRSYTVERSANSRDFSAIGTVPSLGTTAEERTYTLNDATPLKGANYYRLKIEDGNGKLSYSSVRVLSFDAVLHLTVYPNPVQDIASVSGLEPGMQVTIISMYGQELIKKKALGNTIEISLKHLPAAVYEVQVQDGGGKLAGSYRIAKD